MEGKSFAVLSKCGPAHSRPSVSTGSLSGKAFGQLSELCEVSSWETDSCSIWHQASAFSCPSIRFLRKFLFFGVCCLNNLVIEVWDLSFFRLTLPGKLQSLLFPDLDLEGFGVRNPEICLCWNQCKQTWGGAIAGDIPLVAGSHAELFFRGLLTLILCCYCCWVLFWFLETGCN